MAKKVQLMTNAKEWQTVNGVEVLVDVPQEDINPITDSSCVEIEGYRTLEETINQENMFTPEIIETKVHSKVGGVYHDNVVDGAYEEAILYGNTQVNLVESVTTDTKYIPHSFTSFQGNESKIGNYNSGRTNQVAPLVKGVTMVNLCQETSLTIQYQHTRAIANRNAKPNTKYTLKCKFTEKNKNAGIMIQSYGYKDGTWGYIEISKTIQNLGDDVLLTFTTHEQADSIIIYNNPAFCEDTNDSITLDDIMVIEGDVTDLNLPFFKGMRSVELSRPLTNLLHDGIYKTYGSTTQLNYSNGNVTVTANAIGTWQSANFHFTNGDKLKPNTKYIVMWDSLTQTQTSTSSGSIIAVYDTKSGDGNINIGTANSKSECPVLRSIVFDTTGRDASGIVLRIHATLSNSETGTTTVKGLRVFEWDDSLRTLDLQTIGYFSGTKYVSARALETEGKNLYPYGDINFTSVNTSWFDSKGTELMYGDIALKSKARFLLKKGSYIASFSECTNVYNSNIQIVDDKEEIIRNVKIDNTSATFTLMNDTYCTVRVMPSAADVSVAVKNIQIERGETATTYEAYQSRYYKPRETEEIILRSLPNGVCDTFNLQTGELVQNIGEVMLNGSEDEDWLQLEFSGASTVNGIADTYICYGLLLKDKGRLTKNMLLYGAERHVIDTLNISSVYGDTCNQADISTEMVCIHQNGRFYLRLRKDRFSSTDLAGWKLWFSQNPITVQYELKEPIITKLQTYARVYSGQTNARANMGNNLSALTYYSSNYYVKVGNLSPVPSIIEPITSIPYDVRLKPSTLYTVKYNRGGNSNSMKFDLGGSVVEKTNSITSTTGNAEELTVRTPAILSHEQLQLSGTGYAHNFIIVEGDITGTELPYFEGMKDVKMPIVKNIGKNLFHGGFELGTMSSATGEYTDVTTAIRATDYTKVMGGKQYVFYCDDLYYKFAYVQYDKNKKFLRTSGGYVSGAVITLQPDVEYVIMRTPDGQSPLMNNPHVKLALYEYEEGMDTTPQDHKENSVYAVQGEHPITSEMFEQGGFNGTDRIGQPYDNCKVSENKNIRIRTKELIPIKSNTQYIILNQTSPHLNHVFYYFDGNKKFLGQQAEVNTNKFTTPNDCCYVSLMFSKNNNANITTTDVKQEQFHMYELDSTINLRSLPNGVKDELNLLTGEYIQRVGEVVVDGSGDYTEHIHTSSTHYGFRVPVTLKPKTQQYETYPRPILCDKLPSIEYGSYFNGSAEGVSMYVGESTTITSVYVSFDRNRINMPQENNNIDHVKEYCKTNPLTIQYELAQPIISHVRLVSNNQEREVGVKLPRGQVNTYNPSTGITTVRVGKIVLDGSENWILDTTKTNTQVFELSVTDMRLHVNNNIVCDKLPLTNGDNSDTEKIAATQTTEANGVTWGIYIALLKTKASTVDELKTYLASNPITVWYELKYPQIQPDIVLPNGVHDEYNPETGVYTKKVGFFEFDGSADEGWRAAQTDPNRFVCEILTDRKYYPHDTVKDCILCDNIVVVSYKELYGTDGTDGAYGIAPYMGNINIQMRLEGITTAEQLQQYLSQNPIKVWYELATPITYQLTPYFGLPQPYAYEDGYLIHESAYPETTLPPEFKYKLVANRTGQIVQNGRKLQEHTTRLSNLEALIIEATIQSLFDRELQTFELELMDIQLIDLGE